MPWTIWPALVVLWGVCWMFFDELSCNFGDQREHPTTGSTTGPFEDVDYIDPSQGNYPLYLFYSKGTKCFSSLQFQ
jgi:hypothetical protein